MDNRMEQLAAAVLPMVQECVAARERQIIEQLREKADEIMQSLTAALERNFMQAAKLQKAEKMQPLAYLCFAILQSDILLDRHTLQLDAYDTMLYLDKCEVSTDWEIEWLFPCFAEDCTRIEQHLKRTLTRVQAYELKEVRRAYSMNYYATAALVLPKLLPAVMEKADLHEVQLQDEVQITIGMYMEQQQSLYTWRKQS